ncbi:MAG TPA: hypothetical protein DCX06_12335 [Opitutae bacterium]|nr:hypothetical protein [Opitutae bacterium]
MNNSYLKKEQGERSAKGGMILIIISNLILLSPHILPINMSTNSYLLFGGLSTIGFVMFFAGLSKYSYKKPWAFWFLGIYALLLLRTPPVGTVLGLFSLCYLVKTRAAFFAKNTAQ